MPGLTFHSKGDESNSIRFPIDISLEGLVPECGSPEAFFLHPVSVIAAIAYLDSPTIHVTYISGRLGVAEKLEACSLVI